MGLAPRLLGGHVAWRTHDCAGVGLSRVGVQALGQAKVGDLGLAFGRQKHVGRLQVAMDDVAPVGFAHGQGEVAHHFGGLAGRLRLAVDLLGEAAAGHELEREYGSPSCSPTS